MAALCQGYAFRLKMMQSLCPKSNSWDEPEPNLCSMERRALGSLKHQLRHSVCVLGSAVGTDSYDLQGADLTLKRLLIRLNSRGEKGSTFPAPHENHAQLNHYLVVSSSDASD